MSTRTRRAVAPLQSVMGVMLLGVVAACGGTDAAPVDSAPVTQQIGGENIIVATSDSIVGGPLLTGALVPSREARIRAEVAGRVLSTAVEAGQRVSAGTVLARIDDASLSDDAMSARSGLTTAELTFTQAERELERARTLAKAGAIAVRDVESAERAALQARAGLDDAKARVAARDKALGNTTLRAPFSGVVSERAVNAGDIVTPGAAMFTIVDPSSLRLEGSVPAEAAGRVAVGAPVDFALNGYPGRVFAGRVTQVNPVADPVTRQVRIIATIPNLTGTLVGGLFAEGRVATESHVGVVVPDAAVDQRGLNPFAVRVRNGQVERVDVTLGVRDAANERLEILTGVTAGDTLLLGAARAISVGTPVRVSEPSDAKRAPATPAPSAAVTPAPADSSTR